MSEKFKDYLARKTYKHLGQLGKEFDPSDLAPQFIPYFENGDRIEVDFYWKGEVIHTARGTVGVTTGWKPVFLLMPRRDSTGSSETLGVDDRIVKVTPNRRVSRG